MSHSAEVAEALIAASPLIKRNDALLKEVVTTAKSDSLLNCFPLISLAGSYTGNEQKLVSYKRQAED